MLPYKILIPSLLAIPTLATIPSTLAKITTDIRALNQSLATFTGDDTSLTNVLGNSTALKNDINAGATEARASPPVAFKDALQLASATAQLAADTRSTITTLIATKTAFDKVGVTEIVVSMVKDLKSATGEFSGAVIEKLPLELAPVGEQLVGLIDGQFERGIGAFEGDACEAG
ncbi:hydrophobic surface binding protein A domain-containing protein [Pochonia chlamydosporia 170]|uniref:Hydrophobic surface binding protein A domain-containing protein n=1 Tax=Pochonia chlamydosporia 170 TaxID=1380566 RepID=A0A179FQR5_METCM|nr:hydrophobic surface binding protein A domain-containing protein [Pochonia chlamydosporia 170]OAQ67707.1 hydrophobic surface binding protein A domain-containing protein [Pochonia chlamydosporia 170]